MTDKLPHSQQDNTPSDNKPGQDKTDPVMVGLDGAGLGGGVPGALIGCAIGFWVGSKVNQNRNS